MYLYSYCPLKIRTTLQVSVANRLLHGYQDPCLHTPARFLTINHVSWTNITIADGSEHISVHAF